jgi:alkylation response protein AidB-like acyl-CoA dehydrogenase
MDLSLTPGQSEWLDPVRELARERIAPGARAREEAHAVSPEVVRDLGRSGLLGVNVPRDLGGSERGVVAYAHAVREIGRADAAVAVTMAVSNMVAEVIVRFGTEAQKRRHVPRIAGAEYFAGAFALSESGSGSDAASLTTRAERSNGRWLLNGEKTWITSGDGAGVIVVWARTGPDKAKGITCFLLEGGAPGLSAGKPEEKMGLRASHTVSLSLEDVEVDDSAVLGEVGGGFRIAMVALDGGRIGVASQAVGIADAALEHARALALAPSSSGELLSESQDIQFLLANATTDIEAAWLLTLRAAWMKEREMRFSREAAMAKAFASEAANRACRAAVQVAGAHGHLDDYVASRCLRDCRVTQIYEGTSEVQRVVISREVLKSGVLP